MLIFEGGVVLKKFLFIRDIAIQLTDAYKLLMKLEPHIEVFIIDKELDNCQVEVAIHGKLHACKDECSFVILDSNITEYNIYSNHTISCRNAENFTLEIVYAIIGQLSCNKYRRI